MRAVLLAVTLAACDPTGYYVAAVYQDGTQLYVKLCEIDQNRRPSPGSCHVEPVGPLPTSSP